MKNENNKSVSSGFIARRTLLIFVIVVLAVILVGMLVGVWYLESRLGLINRNVDNSVMTPSEYEEFMNNQETDDAGIDGPVLNPEDVIWGGGSGTIQAHEGIVNVLLIGQDRREGQGRQRSDAMILCTIDYPKKTVTLTSFMRDMYVQIPGFDDNRINACYQIGGMQLLDSCLEKNFGVVVDGNIEVDFDGFMGVIDLLGGVDLELTQSEANYLNSRGNWDVDDSTAGQWNLKEGVNHMTGEQALAYSRIRYIGNADFGRTERQRKVLTALFEACNGLSIGQLNDLMNTLLPLMTTDMTDGQLISYAYDAFTIFSEMKIETLRIPADGTFQDARIKGMSVLVPDLEANRALLEEVLS